MVPAETFVVQGTDYTALQTCRRPGRANGHRAGSLTEALCFSALLDRKCDYPVEIEVCAAGGGCAATPIYAGNRLSSPSSRPTLPMTFVGLPMGPRSLLTTTGTSGWRTETARSKRGSWGGRSPRWSPDGGKILFVRGSEHNEVLSIINADGANRRK